MRSHGRCCEMSGLEEWPTGATRGVDSSGSSGGVCPGPRLSKRALRAPFDGSLWCDVHFFLARGDWTPQVKPLMGLSTRPHIKDRCKPHVCLLLRTRVAEAFRGFRVVPSFVFNSDSLAVGRAGVICGAHRICRMCAAPRALSELGEGGVLAVLRSTPGLSARRRRRRPGPG